MYLTLEAINCYYNYLVSSAPPVQNSAMLGETQGRKKETSQWSGFGMFDLWRKFCNSSKFVFLTVLT